MFRTVRWLLVLGVAAAASAGTFDGLRAAIDARLSDPTLSRPRAAALRKAKDRLTGSAIVVDEARAAWRCASILARDFPRSAAFAGAEWGTADQIEDALTADRGVLASYEGVYGDEVRIRRGVARADADLARAARARGALARLRSLALAASDLRTAFPPQPDFRLVDLNDKTPTSGQEISPRDQYGLISVWYFGRAG